MQYTSTRDKKVSVSGTQAIVQGISKDGGLFVPEFFPAVTLDEIKRLGNMSYPERAALILHKYLDDFSFNELLGYAEKAYADFEDGDPCPAVKIDDSMYILELTHGPTLAFKDMALALLPYLLTACKEKLGVKDKTLILVATSGDTGKAALEGFKDVAGTEIVVFYPEKGVSSMQKLQMMSQAGENVHVCGIKGNFDDAQSAVKSIFTDEAIGKKLAENGYSLSSANSINWGRLLPQIVYYFSAYADLLAAGEIEDGQKISFAVPTGNFGNILAGYYAKRMGLPVENLICASNQNKILSDFFEKGEYDINRDFYKTMSPSMDILISSNLERLLFELYGRDADKIAELMAELKEDGFYKVDEKVFKNLGLISGWADEDDTKAAIAGFYETNDYVLDPHTAVAVSVYNDYFDATGDETVTVVVSTANPYKFPADVYAALTGFVVEDEFKAAQKLYNMTGEEIPLKIKDLKDAEKVHCLVVGKDETVQAVFDFLQIK